MSGKNQYPIVYNWQSNDPRIGFLPQPSNQSGTIPSGNPNGVMTGLNTIYSQIVETSRMDNVGLEVMWNGTAVGVFSILASCSGINWNALTFNPVLAQPAGVMGGMGIDLNQYPFKFLLLQYVNASGVGVLNAYGQYKDLN